MRKSCLLLQHAATSAFPSLVKHNLTERGSHDVAHLHMLLGDIHQTLGSSLNCTTVVIALRNALQQAAVDSLHACALRKIDIRIEM